MKRFRKSLTVLICAAVLAGTPVRQAHAIPLLDEALKILTIPLVLLMGSSAKLEGVLMVINTKIPIMIETMKIKQREKLAKALDETRKKTAQKALDAETMRDYRPDVTHNACVLITGGQDIPTVEVVTSNQRATMNKDAGNLARRGSVIGWRDRAGRKVELDPLKQQIEEYRSMTNRYGGPNDVAAAEKVGKTKEQMKNNEYRGANTRVTTITNTGAFDEDRHYIAAMDFCVAMTGNTALPYAQGRALSEDIDNIYQFNLAMSSYAAQDIASYICQYPILRKLPIDSKFAKTDPEFKLSNERLAEIVATASQNAGQQKGADDAKPRDLPSINARARAFLTDQNAGGYIEVDPTGKKIDEPSADAAKKLIKGQMVSTEQIDESEYVYKWYSNQYTSTVDAASKSLRMSNIYITRLYNAQLIWKQYENLEREVMMEAIQLARQVRQAQRNPGAVTPTN